MICFINFVSTNFICIPANKIITWFYCFWECSIFFIICNCFIIFRCTFWFASINVTYNGTYKEISKVVPERTGYTFKGWYDQETGGEQITKDTKVEVIDNNTKLYAILHIHYYK